MRKSIVIGVATAIAVFVLGVFASEADARAPTALPHPPVPLQTQEPWDYSHQQLWPDDCNRGLHRQSPIDFRVAKTKSEVGNYALRFHGPCVLSADAASGIEPVRHAFVINDPKLKCAVDDPVTGERYEVHELHFHYTGEHVLPSGPTDFELHMVFNSRKDLKHKLVVATSYKSGHGEQVQANAAFLDIFRSGASHRDAAEDTSLFDMLPAAASPMLYYSGSLTTPPCWETVQWVVFSKPVTVSPRVVRELKNDMKAHAGTPFTNNRDIQNRAGSDHRYNVLLLNTGGYRSWAMFDTQHDARRYVLLLFAVVVLGGIGLLLYFHRDHDSYSGDAHEEHELAPIVTDEHPGGVTVDGDSAAVASPPADETPTRSGKKQKHVSYGTL